MEGGEDGPMNLLGGPTADVRAAVQENLEQADHEARPIAASAALALATGFEIPRWCRGSS